LWSSFVMLQQRLQQLLQEKLLLENAEVPHA
jgi:hypothetical protein